MHASGDFTDAGYKRRKGSGAVFSQMQCQQQHGTPIDALPSASTKSVEPVESGLVNVSTGIGFEDTSAMIASELMAPTPPFLYSDFFSNDLSNLDVEAGSMPTFSYESRTSAFGGCHTAPDPATPVSGCQIEGSVDSSAKPWVEARYQPHDAAGPSALLHVFYRLSSPKSLLGLSGEDFVRHYFRHVCQLHSSFDSDLNPLRNLVAGCWTGCSTVYLTIQSMAIAHIANYYPYMAPLGVSKRSEAWRSLQRDLHHYRLERFGLDKILLSLLLLGVSANWHSSTELGLQYLHIARNLMQAELSSGKEMEQSSDFWKGALIHWEMLASFVDNVPLTTFDGHGLPNLQVIQTATPRTPVMPHPLTGLATDLHFALAEIGRVLRRQQGATVVDSGPEQLREIDFRWLESLEQFLLTTVIPKDDLIDDYHDPATSKTDLIHTAEACRGVCLLEIYRLYPDLLNACLNNEEKRARFPFTLPDDHSCYNREIDSQLANIAAQIVKLLTDVPLASGACHLHPLLLVASACQLRFPDQESSSSQPTMDRNDRMTHHRYLVEARTLSLSRKQPQGPLLKAMDVIKEVWGRLDNAEEAHWLRVMHEKGWQTIIG